VLGFYPTDYSGATEILLRCERSMIFGDVSTVKAWTRDPRVQIHGPGWSKVLLGPDVGARWTEHLDLMVASVADNGGRSCLNASGIWVASHGREVAEALARRLGEVEALPLDDPAALLAAFPDARAARRVSRFIDDKLRIPGAHDLTAAGRADRVVEVGGCSFVLPTVVWCEDPEHPLARTELLFPFVSVVEVPGAEMLERIGPTLAATAITEEAGFLSELRAARSIERLNLGAIPTSRVSWDQPHEGNLFEHLYGRRAFQAAAGA
jgi:acyl-CoA reductase-like NAD-dependent aldehyde dehydrogenase